MAEPKVEPRKIRDFSENLNDTFLFIRQNFKLLITSFLAIAGIFMLAHSIINAIYQQNAAGILRDMLSGNTGSDRYLSSPLGDFFNLNYFLLLLLTWANFIATNVVVTCFMKLYDSNGRVAPTVEDVWNEFKKYFLIVFFYSIPIVVVIAFGYLFCLIPGIYLSVVFAPFATILIIENQTFGGAWERCFKLIKNNFWPSFGIYIVVYLICAVAAGIISAVVAGAVGLISYFTTNNMVSTIGIITSILSVLSYIFYIILYVSFNFHYFNLAERHDGTGLMQRLDSLGNTDRANDIQEEY